MARTRLHYTEKGHLGQYEDWWYLVTNDDGSMHIEHEWDHVTVNGLAKRDGTKVMTIEEARKEAPATAIANLDKLLG